ncbi:MAG: hypothetical protein LQ349_002430 [Xanthoria aureola]|nr:MAG: hypothetical protein LQ349_002430 [Xanthoria aureola]
MSGNRDMDDHPSSQGLGDPKLLEIIDKLVELNIGDTVALPQLLVVGDQSSGKSSVLEGITGLPFPRDSSLCTRFATQITFRRAAHTRFNLSIIPSQTTSKEEAARLKDWKLDGMKSLNRKDFSRILDEVHNVMGIGNASAGAKKSFSDDVLKIEVIGPDQQHLGVVDVPGIFRKITEGVTTQSDMVSVRSMVERYMANPRSIIMAVVPANVDIATQEILEIAKVHDPTEQRTLGVLTKPDLIDKGAEDHVLDLIQGTTHTLSLGWCMVKNPGQQDLKRGDDFDRHASEKAFFGTHEIWSKVDNDKVGVDSLRLRLVELLTAIVQKEFKHVRSDVMQNLKASEKKLNALGPSRETREQQQKYLLKLADRFQSMTANALEARYAGDNAFESMPRLRLATAMVTRNEIFSSDVWHRGLTMRFVYGKPKDKPAEGENENHKSSSDSDEAPPSFHDPQSGEDMVPTRYQLGDDDLDDILYNERIPASPDKGIMKWMEKVYNSSRGYEMGTFDVSLIPFMWKQQTLKWEDLALGYTSDIISTVHTYIRDLLKEICQEDRVRSTLLSVMMDPLIERYKRAMDQTRSILEVEHNPMTYNHYFAENLEKCHQERTKALIEGQTFHDGDNRELVQVSALFQNMNISNLESTVQHLHDILKSYYKVSRKRFVDNVCMQAADRHLTRGPDTAVKLFSPSFVSGLTAEQLERIAGEDMSTKKKRVELTRHVANLKQARNLLVVV